MDKLAKKWLSLKGLKNRSVSMEIGFAAILLVMLALCVMTFMGPPPGTVSVTVTVDPFSPTVVKVGDSATTTLTATPGNNYYPPVPSGDESSLSDSYAWTLTVLYRSTANGTFSPAGPPGAKNYTYWAGDPTLPNTLSDDSPINLQFTPGKTGYWEVSATCTLTVTDTKNTNLTWSGTNSGGPADLTGYTLDVTYTGSVAGGTSDSGTVVTNQTTNVHAGWPIQLGAVLSPADLATTFTWTIDGAGGNGSAAIAGYDPTSGPTYVTYLVPANATGTTFPGTNKYYYYTASGSETASVTATGNGISPAKTTFSVTEPTASVSTVTDRVNVWSQSGELGFGGWMANPQKDGGSPGIDFTDAPGQNSGFGGKFDWIQFYRPEQSYWDANGNLIDILSGSGLDTLNRAKGGVFYGISPPNDSPFTSPPAVLNGPVDKIVVSDNATMWLMYQPKAAGSLWVPIDSVNWNWGGTETLANGTWSLTNGNWSKNPSGQATNSFPEWDGYCNLTPVQSQ